jgi:hypothetical protein
MKCVPKSPSDVDADHVKIIFKWMLSLPLSINNTLSYVAVREISNASIWMLCCFPSVAKQNVKLFESTFLHIFFHVCCF